MDVVSRQRHFWNPTLTFAAIFLPLSIGGTLLAIYALGVGPSTAVKSLLLFSTLGLFSAGVAAFLFARRITESVSAASDVLQQASTGDFDGRISAEQRTLIEPLAESADRMQEYLR